jgi:type II secretory pathway pseudopilin PulG
MKEKQPSFTVVELLVSIAVIALLSGFVVATAGYVQGRSKRSRAQVEIAAISTALENYRSDNGVYPSNELTNSLNPATTTPDSYIPTCSFLYSQLSGDSDANPLTSPTGLQNYFGNAFKLYMLAPNPPGPNTYLRDPFRNSYGYSTAKATNPEGLIGHNSTFDLWSTAGCSDTSQWIKNW